MFRAILPIILIIIAISGFFLFTNPLYHQVNELRDKIASYDEALGNAKTLEAERDKLTQKYNSLNPADLNRLEKLLPDNVDNIRLILEIEKVASTHGMSLKDIQYDTLAKNTENEEAVVVTEEMELDRKEYGTWNLEFSVEGSYQDFLNFVQDLESNLRIIDLASIQFSSEQEKVVVGKEKIPSDIYQYDFKIKTYWLKN